MIPFWLFSCILNGVLCLCQCFITRRRDSHSHTQPQNLSVAVLSNQSINLKIVQAAMTKTTTTAIATPTTATTPSLDSLVYRIVRTFSNVSWYLHRLLFTTSKLSSGLRAVSLLFPIQNQMNSYVHVVYCQCICMCMFVCARRVNRMCSFIESKVIEWNWSNWYWIRENIYKIPDDRRTVCVYPIKSPPPPSIQQINKCKDNGSHNDYQCVEEWHVLFCIIHKYNLLAITKNKKNNNNNNKKCECVCAFIKWYIIINY